MSKLPVHKPVDWRHAGLNILVLASFCGIGFWLGGSNGVLFAAALFLFLSASLRSLLASHHRKGVVLCKSGNFADAIEEFKRSLAFFERHAWIDQYRGITMLSSGHSYIEMALVSIGFSYIQLNQREQARNYYQTCLKSFPTSHMAIAALHYLDSTEKASTEEENHG